MKKRTNKILELLFVFYILLYWQEIKILISIPSHFKINNFIYFLKASLNQIDTQAVSKVQFTNKPSIGHPIKSSSEIHKAPTKHLDEDNRVFLDEQYKLMQIQQNSSRLSLNSDISAIKSSRSAENKENTNLSGQDGSRDNYNLLTQRSLIRNHRHVKRAEGQLDIDGVDKTKFLFEYLYGMKGE